MYMVRLWFGMVVGLLLLALLIYGVACAPTLRVATFNIEDFPKSQRQIEGAFEVMDELALDVVGVQEIMKPRVFERELRERLGKTWRFEYARSGGPRKVGVLWDATRFALMSTRTHDSLRLTPGSRPAFELRLRSRWDAAPPLRVIVVHLKAGGDGFALRKEQYKRLGPIMHEAVASGDRVVLLGDMNSTGEADRAELRALSEATGLRWATRKVACSMFWNRKKDCVGSALDHILTTEPPESVKARGPCEAEGCKPRQECPVFHGEVSDHCPVTIDF